MFFFLFSCAVVYQRSDAPVPNSTQHQIPNNSFLYIHLYKVSNEPSWKYAHPPLDYLQHDWQREWKKCHQSVECCVCGVTERHFTSSQESEKKKRKNLPWLHIDCTVQPNSHFSSASVGDSGNENVFSSLCSGLNHNVNISTSAPEKPFLSHTSSKSKSISCC